MNAAGASVTVISSLTSSMTVEVATFSFASFGVSAVVSFVSVVTRARIAMVGASGCPNFTPSSVDCVISETCAHVPQTVAASPDVHVRRGDRFWRIVLSLTAFETVDLTNERRGDVCYMFSEYCLRCSERASHHVCVHLNYNRKETIACEEKRNSMLAKTFFYASARLGFTNVS